MYWPHAATLNYAVASAITGYCAFRLWRADLSPFWLTWALVSAMSAMFSVAWGFVAFDSDLDRATWSETITPGSTIFPLLFALPALVIVVRGTNRKT